MGVIINIERYVCQDRDYAASSLAYIGRTIQSVVRVFGLAVLIIANVLLAIVYRTREKQVINNNNVGNSVVIVCVQCFRLRSN
jgi:hypothetical protein